MEIKLKTLKDFYLSNDPQFDDNPLCLTDDNLKQEAIKHIKELTKDGYDRCPKITITGEQGQLMKAMIKSESSLVADWIKHFFNITEEDLE